MKRRTSNNKKRRITKEKLDKDVLYQLSKQIKYGGNPEHKRSPGDFGLKPPSLPQADKSKCETANVSEIKVACRLLKNGVNKGLISEQKRGKFPQNIWAVNEEDFVFEAQLENREKGSYHGYPLLENDPFREEVLKHWNKE